LVRRRLLRKAPILGVGKAWISLDSLVRIGTYEAAGASLRYLPPYSPDFNPIEMAFAKLKSLLRAAAARTIPDLWQAIADALRRFTPQECANYLAAAGYDAI
jgi:transposase